jgi:hypothetical protein
VAKVLSIGVVKVLSREVVKLSEEDGEGLSRGVAAVSVEGW